MARLDSEAANKLLLLLNFLLRSHTRACTFRSVSSRAFDEEPLIR